MTYNTKTLSYDTRVRIFWTLACAALLAFAVYIYAVNMTIRNTVARQELKALVAEKSAELSVLEFEYITKRSNIGMELASTYGLKEVRNPSYASHARGNTLTLNTVSR